MEVGRDILIITLFQRTTLHVYCTSVASALIYL